jgi:hypothetical protein
VPNGSLCSSRVADVTRQMAALKRRKGLDAFHVTAATTRTSISRAAEDRDLVMVRRVLPHSSHRTDLGPGQP